MLESELVSTTARPLDEGRPETVTEPHPPGKMALCLSGGGLRATFFHLGVVRFLADAGYLNNENLRIISSVSGGCIMAAHLVKNWGLYTNPDTFDAAAADLIAFGQSDLRGRVVRRSLLRYLVRWLPIGESRGDWRSNTCLLMREYRRLFSTTREEILRRHAGGSPGRLRATSFATAGSTSSRRRMIPNAIPRRSARRSSSCIRPA